MTDMREALERFIKAADDCGPADRPTSIVTAYYEAREDALRALAASPQAALAGVVCDCDVYCQDHREGCRYAHPPASSLPGREEIATELWVSRGGTRAGAENNLHYVKQGKRTYAAFDECLKDADAILALLARPVTPGDREPPNWREVEIVRLIDLLRSKEGGNVTLFCDNPDFNDQPNCAIICNGEWTNWQDRRFAKDTILDALSAAMIEYMRPSEATPAEPIDAQQPEAAARATNEVTEFQPGWLSSDVGLATEQAAILRELGGIAGLIKEIERLRTAPQAEPVYEAGWRDGTEAAAQVALDQSLNEIGTAAFTGLIYARAARNIADAIRALPSPPKGGADAT